jgi:sarcosine/dimethylglycine N-methyltransferase
MRDDGERAIFFYSRHPISAEIILSKLRASRGKLDGLRPEELYPHDQDHYGGLDANDVLAAATGIGEGAKVADFCAGLGGPARYFAHRYGAFVTGVELTPARVKGANELTQLVGLQERVRIVEGNIMAAPLADKSIDVVISQEALLHIPDRRRAMSEAFRILKQGGRLAFTDWVAHEPLAADDVDLLWEGQAVQALESPRSYRDLLTQIGFRVSSSDELRVACEFSPIGTRSTNHRRRACRERVGYEARLKGLRASPMSLDSIVRTYQSTNWMTPPSWTMEYGPGS